MSSPTGQQLRFDPKTQSYYALDPRTGIWTPVRPPNPSNQPRTPLPSNRLPATQGGVAPRSPPSATNSNYTTAAPDAASAAAQLQGLNIGASAPLPTRATLDPGIVLPDSHVYTNTESSRLSGSRSAKAVLQVR